MWRLLWRFLTGLHLDGKTRRHPNGKVKPQFKNIYWNRIGRPRRAGIRLLTVGIMLGIMVGRYADWWLTRFVLLAISPFACLWLARNIAKRLAQRVSFHDGDGVATTYWTLKPKYAQRVRALKQWRFHWFPPETTVITPDQPEARAILADNAESGGEPATMMRRPLAELLIEEAAPRDGRSRTMSRRRRPT